MACVGTFDTGNGGGGGGGGGAAAQAVEAEASGRGVGQPVGGARHGAAHNKLLVLRVNLPTNRKGGSKCPYILCWFTVHKHMDFNGFHTQKIHSTVSVFKNVQSKLL